VRFQARLETSFLFQCLLDLVMPQRFSAPAIDCINGLNFVLIFTYIFISIFINFLGIMFTQTVMFTDGIKLINYY